MFIIFDDDNALINDERIDEYYWLKEKDNPKVIDYLNAENSYRDKYMKDYRGLEKNYLKKLNLE